MDAPKPNIPEKIPTNIEKPIEVLQESNSPEKPPVEVEPAKNTEVKADDSGPTIGPEIDSLSVDEALNLETQKVAKPKFEVSSLLPQQDIANSYLNKN